MSSSAKGKTSQDQSRSFVRLFFIPLVLAIGFGIVIDFWIVQTQKKDSFESLVQNIQKTSGKQRWKNAYRLAQLLNRDNLAIPEPVVSDLIQMVQNPNQYDGTTRAQLILVLSRSADNRAVLSQALHDADIEVRWGAALGLAHQGSDEGLEILLQMLDRDYLNKVRRFNDKEIEKIVINAAKGLSEIKTFDSGPVFKKMIQEEPSRRIRNAVAALLNQSRY